MNENNHNNTYTTNRVVVNKAVIQKEMKKIAKEAGKSTKQKLFDNMLNFCGNYIVPNIKGKFCRQLSTNSNIQMQAINKFLYKINRKKYINCAMESYISCKLDKEHIFSEYSRIFPKVDSRMCLKYNGTIILFHYKPDDGMYPPRYNIEVYGLERDVNRVYREILYYIRKEHELERKSSNFTIYTIKDASPAGGYGRLELCVSKPKRYFDSIFIEEDKKNKILDYINNIQKVNAYFNKFNLYPNRNILLYGPPGTGKTSIIYAIISLLQEAYNNRNIFVGRIELSSIGGSLDHLYTKCREEASFRKTLKVLMLEDIDYIFGKREEERTMEEKENANNLLQLLDGSLSIEGSICIATTNKIESLDKAIIREGRFDLQLSVDNISIPLAEEMIKYYGLNYDNFILSNEDIINSDRKINPAKLQSRIIEHVIKNKEVL